MKIIYKWLWSNLGHTFLVYMHLSIRNQAIKGADRLSIFQLIINFQTKKTPAQKGLHYMISQMH